MTRQHLIAAFSALALIATAGLLTAGPINPPVGPVAFTAKPLSEVEPRTAINATNTPGTAASIFRITQPGSYYLTGNITGVVGKHGVEIVASGVTLDLNGFDLVGVMGSLDGVSSTGLGQANVSVLNGSVRGWGGDGVDLFSQSVTNGRVEGVLARNNLASGIRAGDTMVVARCTVTANTADGIFAGGKCTISGCTSTSNTGNGFASSFTCLIGACISSNNGGAGFLLSGGAVVEGCTAQFNGGAGIVVDAGSTVSRSTTLANSNDGIRCSFGANILNNVCRQDGGTDGAGIHVTGFHNRIEGNNCSTAKRGIDVDSAGNVIIRNISSGNTVANWDVVANNICLVVHGATGMAILGNAGGVPQTATDPNVNFSY